MGLPLRAVATEGDEFAPFNEVAGGTDEAVESDGGGVVGRHALDARRQ